MCNGVSSLRRGHAWLDLCVSFLAGAMQAVSHGWTITTRSVPSSKRPMPPFLRPCTLVPNPGVFHAKCAPICFFSFPCTVFPRPRPFRHSASKHGARVGGIVHFLFDFLAVTFSPPNGKESRANCLPEPCNSKASTQKTRCATE